MSIRPIVRWPDAQLSAVCTEIEKIDEGVRVLAQDMLETMYAAPGRGLAAPQVGVLSRMFVMDTNWKESARAPMVFVNPRIVEHSADTVAQSEGCLSIPGVSVDVTRPVRVHLHWRDLEGQDREQTFEGFAAACVQHELDHLDGIVTLDRIAPDVRARVLQTYNEVTV